MVQAKCHFKQVKDVYLWRQGEIFSSRAGKVSDGRDRPSSWPYWKVKEAWNNANYSQRLGIIIVVSNKKVKKLFNKLPKKLFVVVFRFWGLYEESYNL